MDAVFLTFILMLSIFLGFELINKVPSTLHTPLMSGSNAISGITLVGALSSAGGGFEQLGMQALMVLIIGAWVTVTVGTVFFILKSTIGLRVTAEEEIEGLDFLEHGLQGYAPDMSHT